MNYPAIVKIKNVVKENQDVKTIAFTHDEPVMPGQFYMVWIPGVDEIPMSVSIIDKEVKGFTFRRVGDATRSLFSMKTGDQIGIRGPFGNGFEIKGKNILLVGGGTGIAMLYPALEKAVKQKISATMIIGVKNKDELFFKEKIERLGVNLLVSTDDGSIGYHGFASDLAEKTLLGEQFSHILTCGPEKMMKKILDISGRIPFQASLERYMKCAIGICGQCCIGDGLRVCKDGPIFSRDTLNKVEDFGKTKRDAAGRKIKI